MSELKVPDNWWKLLKAVEHNWGKTVQIRPYGKYLDVQYCETCDAMRFVREDGTFGDPQFHSCRITTDYPGDDSPCLCTRKGYLIDHKLIKAS